MIESGFAKINNLFGEWKITAFWNGIKMKQQKRINSAKDDSNFNNLQEHV